MKLPLLYALALVELEASPDPADAALLQRLRDGTSTSRDAGELVEVMACLADEHRRLQEAEVRPGGPSAWTLRASA